MERDRSEARTTSFGQLRAPSSVDRLGVWLSGRAVRRVIPTFAGLTVADIGCGYKASFAESIANEVQSMTLVDLAITSRVLVDGRINAIQGTLPGVLSTLQSDHYDAVLCLSVLEHLWDHEAALAHFYRMAKRDGLCIINVPTWRGKRFLEFSAFRLGLSPRSEMDDHKRYYDPADLWPLLVRAGFVPHNIRLRRHKGGMNLVAYCRK